ncbi:Uncharacterised protein [Achromobacter xylosoxidans]|nr:Uncharacterised protein [Achromobacter xylosoxidans]
MYPSGDSNPTARARCQWPRIDSQAWARRFSMCGVIMAVRVTQVNQSNSTGLISSTFTP